MKTLSWILAGLVCGLVLASPAHSGNAAVRPRDVPITPDYVFGLVRVNNLFVPAGTLVSAWCGGIKVVERATDVNELNESVYVLEIPGDAPSTPAKDGCASGETISFKIAGNLADQQKSWTEGGFTQLDLSLTNLIPIYIPLVMK
jgi:hypothetical protein